MKPVVHIIAALVAGAMLTGCAGRPSSQTTPDMARPVRAAPLTSAAPHHEEDHDMPMTIDTAKALAIGLADELAATVPAALVVRDVTYERSFLWSCGRPGYESWPGHHTLTLVTAAEDSALLRAMAELVRDRPGWAVTVEPSDASPTLFIEGPGGLNAAAHISTSGEEVRITTYSPCFPFEPLIGEEY